MMPADRFRRLRVVGIAALVFLGVFIVTFNLQVSALHQLQKALVADALPYVMVAPLHGVRILAAWFFGWWSVVVLAPSAAYFYWVMRDQMAFDAGVHLVSLIHLCSGPLAFSLLRLALGSPDRPMRFEWRCIMLAGMISALVNAFALGFYLAPELDSRSLLLWVIGRVVASMLGLLLVLLASLAALRALKLHLKRL